MGNGSCSSARWQPDRKHTPQELITYWQNQALQMRSERDHLSQTVDRLDRVNERLALQISTANKTIAQQNLALAEYRRAFGPIMFSTPEPRGDGR